MKTFTSKKMSEITGLSIPTLRYYEDIGLLDPVQRADNGHRRYSEDDLIRVEFLKHVRATGMSIQQTRHFVDLHRAGQTTVPERLDILEAHRETVQNQMNALAQTLAFLEQKIEIVRQLQCMDMPQALHSVVDSK